MCRMFALIAVAWAVPALADPPRDSDRTRVPSHERERLREDYSRLALASIHRSIERLEALLDKPGVGDLEPEMTLRLAELYAQLGRRHHLDEVDRHGQALEACDRSATCDPSQLTPDHTTSTAWRVDAVSRYRSVMERFPRFDRADVAAFQLGMTQLDLSRPERAEEAFGWLVRTRPDSTYVHDALIQLGEIAFDVKADPRAALVAYRRAASIPGGSKVAYANYRAAWCWFNLGEHDRAIRTMHRVVDDADTEVARAFDLTDEALRDLVRFYAEAGQREPAMHYFASQGREDLIRPTVRALGDAFAERGELDQAIELYRTVLLQDPAHPDNPEVHAAIVDATRQLGQPHRLLARLLELRDATAADSAWATAQEDPARVDAARQVVERHLRTTAVRFHTTGTQLARSRRPDAAAEHHRLAQRTYRAYLEDFADHDAATDVRYAYGELLYALEDFGAAYDQYQAVVALDPQGPHARFCAEAAVHAAEAMMKAAPGAPPPERGPATLTEAETRFLAATEQFARRFPDDEAVTDMVYQSAYLLYDRRRFDEAAAQFRAVIAREPGSREAEYAAQLILDALVVEEDWDALRTTARAFHAQSDLGSARFKRDIYAIYQNASFKLVEATFASSGDALAAAEGFMAFVDAFPDAAAAAKALHNATVHFSAAGHPARAMQARHVLIHDPRFGPSTPYYFDQLAAAGFDHERIADFDTAATYYEAVWRTFVDAPSAQRSPTAADALYSAAVLRHGQGHWERAIAHYASFSRRFPEDLRAGEALLRTAATWADHGEWASAATTYRAYTDEPPPGATDATVWFAQLQEGHARAALGEHAARDAGFDRAIAAFRRAPSPSPEGVEVIAEMMLARAESEISACVGLEIRAPRGSRIEQDRALTRALQRKTAAVRGVEQTLTGIVELGAGEWGVAALVQLGRVYDDMAHTVRTSDVPTYLDASQRRIYQDALADRAYVQEEKAVRAYTVARDRAFALSLYTPPIRYAVRRLSALRPERHPAPGEVIPTEQWTATRGSTTGAFETSLR